MVRALAFVRRLARAALFFFAFGIEECTPPERPPALRRWAYFIPDTIEGQWLPVARGGSYVVDTLLRCRDGRACPLTVWADSVWE